MREIMRLLPPALLAIILLGCTKYTPTLTPGVWRGVIELQGQKLPFNFAVQRDSAGRTLVYLKNADENLVLDEIRTEGDTLYINLHLFDADLRCVVSGDSLKGYYVRNYVSGYKLPFKAAYNQDFRFEPEAEISDVRFDGTYEVVFTNDEEITPAVGIFEQRSGNLVVGTFLTETGDYRYLEGTVVGETLRLSTFDGNHAYLFIAKKTSDSTLVGDYWAGRAWHQTWTATRNENARLTDASTLTYLKEGHEIIDFSFPDVNGNRITPQDEKYKNKVLILQLFGTWCPNCMDETRFLASWYPEHKDKGVEIIGLAYEAKPDFDYASTRVNKMISRLGVTYDFVIAGTSDKTEASKTLPMLNRIVAFPTTIFIGKDGKVKHIHTGFNGPGTGVHYQREIEKFNALVSELLDEGMALSK
jgi:peroxiredoxin